jgi:hypothetical protein
MSHNAGSNLGHHQIALRVGGAYIVSSAVEFARSARTGPMTPGQVAVARSMVLGAFHLVQSDALYCKGRAGLPGWRSHRYECLWPGSQPTDGVAPGTPRPTRSEGRAKFCPAVYDKREGPVPALRPPSACACAATRAHPATGEVPQARIASPSDIGHPADGTPAAIQHDPVLCLIASPKDASNCMVCCDLARVWANWMIALDEAVHGSTAAWLFGVCLRKASYHSVRSNDRKAFQ